MNLESIFQSFPEITTQNLILRRMQSQDTKALFKIMSDDQVTKYYDDETFQDISQARNQIKAWETGYQARRCIRWGITRIGMSSVIGTCGYYGFHTWHMRAGIGYELARPFWRRGIMTEALGAVIDLGFNVMGLNRIEAVVMPENLPSLMLLEKLGFFNEGVLKEYENWGQKGFTDLCMLSLLKNRWRQPAG